MIANLNDEFVTQRLHINVAFGNALLHELLERGGSCMGEYVAMHCVRQSKGETNARASKWLPEVHAHESGVW